MSAAEIFAEYLEDLVYEDPAMALSLITGAFVGLALGIVESKGGDRDKEIHIDGGENRDITIHAPKREGGAK